MRGSLLCSVVLHAALLGWALFTIQTQREIRMSEPEPIAVDLVTPGELTKLRKGARTAKQLEAEAKPDPKAEIAKKEAPKATPPAAAPPPPEPPPAPKEEPRKDPVAEKLASVPPPPQAAPPPPPAPPVPAPEEQKQLDDLVKEQERQAEERKREEEQQREEQRKQAELKKKQDDERKRKEAEAKKKREDERKRKEAEAKKKQFDAEKIAALLNKTPDKAPPPSAQEPPEQPTKNKGPVLGAPEGRDKQLSASEVALLGQIIRSCVQPKWTILGGGEQAQQIEVKMRLRFHPDGRLAAPPQVTNMQGSPYFLAVSDSAVRAVQACEPFSLPPAKYDYWKDIILTFRPTDMF